jgi:hypothetical protein
MKITLGKMTWFDGGYPLEWKDKYMASFAGILHSVVIDEMHEVEVLPTDEEGIAPHPEWGWLAKKGKIVKAFQHRDDARRWVKRSCEWYVES